MKKKKKRVFVTPTETNVHGDALCFMVKAWARHKTTETVLNNGWRLVVGRRWRLAVGGSWRLVVPGGCPEKLSLTKNKIIGLLKDTPVVTLLFHCLASYTRPHNLSYVGKGTHHLSSDRTTSDPTGPASAVRTSRCSV